MPSAADTRWAGRRVVGEINVACGGCECCRRGVKEHCAARGAVDIRPLISGVFPLNEHERAFDAARRGLKVLLGP